MHMFEVVARISVERLCSSHGLRRQVVSGADDCFHDHAVRVGGCVIALFVVVYGSNGFQRVAYKIGQIDARFWCTRSLWIFLEGVRRD